MNNRRIVAGLAAMGAVAAMNVLAACTPSDDNDAFFTPTPEPTAEPTPQFARNCQIIWANQNGSALDVFVVDGPAELWVNGAEAGADGDFTRYYEEEVVLESGVYHVGAPTAVVTSGTFDIVVGLGGTASGQPVGYDDTTPDILYGFDTAGEMAAIIGTGGDGTFTGTWSDSTSPDVVTDCDSVLTGDQPCVVNLTIGTNDIVVGSFGAYATCYEQLVE